MEHPARYLTSKFGTKIVMHSNKGILPIIKLAQINYQVETDENKESILELYDERQLNNVTRQ